ncbi:hypothetical protein LSCM4_04732 [Leishmania orientalis]|uniref:Uncharacterized protein n=1 Tax=Leishmania orientalis TaxID=2249476 RepID=A0A836GR19_9TRYP|nr:hypothetical protein LSCM4_04732 [Leishmania orientalis]
MGSSCTKTQAAINGEGHEGKESFQNEGEKAVNDTNVAAESKCQQPGKDVEAESTEAKDMQKVQDDHEETTRDAVDIKQAGAMGGDAEEGQKIADDAENQVNGSS